MSVRPLPIGRRIGTIRRVVLARLLAETTDMLGRLLSEVEHDEFPPINAGWRASTGGSVAGIFNAGESSENLHDSSRFLETSSEIAS